MPYAIELHSFNFIYIIRYKRISSFVVNFYVINLKNFFGINTLYSRKNGEFVVSEEAKLLLPYARNVIALSDNAKKEIKKGEKFSEKNLTTKRPGSGRSPLLWNKLLGTRSKKNYLKDEAL